jgi:hypothetical protein
MIKMTKMLVFDMDGTIADLYGVKHWLDFLNNENVVPYVVAKPLYDMEMLNRILYTLKNLGWQIAVTTWLSKDCTKEYAREVRQAKREWLERYNFPADEIHIVKYGTPKTKCTRGKADFQILCDDNDDVLERWTLGNTIDAKENLIENLIELISTEF